MNLPSLNKRSYLIIAGVVIFVIIGALSLILNNREQVANPQLPAQVGELTNISGEGTTVENIPETRPETPPANTELSETNDTSAPSEVVITTLPEESPESTPSSETELSTTTTTEDCIPGAGGCDTTTNNRTPIPVPDTGCGGEGQEPCSTGLEFNDTGCTDPTTGAPITCPEDTPPCGTTSTNPCPDPDTGCGGAGQPACGTSLEPTDPGCEIVFDPTTNTTTQNCNPPETGCSAGTAGAPCPEDLGCVASDGTPIECPDPGCDTRAGQNCDRDPGCIDAAGSPITCPEPECDPTLVDCDPPNNVDFCNPNTDPECQNTVDFCNPNTDPECQNTVECTGEGCEPNKVDFCDPTKEICTNTVDFCDPTKEICDEFIPQCIGDECNPPVQEQPPVVQKNPPTSSLKPAAPQAPPVKISATATPPSQLHKSGPGNLLLLIMAPALAYLSTKKRRK